MRILLVRHGQTEGNVRGALDTALPGPPLTELGQQQAKALAQRLSSEPIVAVYASQAIRAQQTAAPLAEAFGFEVQVIDGVKEVDAGELENRSDRASIEVYLRAVAEWTQGALDVAIPGGETGAQVRERMLRAVTELRAKHEEIDPDGAVVLVSHGGAIRLAGEWLAPNVPPELAAAALIPNTASVELLAEPDGWRCLRWVDTVLPPS
ncbi:histidine phosphatase family protein [Amycolatopsis jiangsuensis]|uniref:Putative phosphoglycerate mutase n=1 Tax=Amycolatopsis jiangsuensis TaxID=1181879 RepID=A0A840J071_9PSEU|nr:histidine phosphatase family protein [Amycolatopsis jiangsuensis]MBB4687045.1 putative phosphoglycerate mutase [Amycolatopsis jiangsuensis]